MYKRSTHATLMEYGTLNGSKFPQDIDRSQRRYGRLLIPWILTNYDLPTYKFRLEPKEEHRNKKKKYNGHSIQPRKTVLCDFTADLLCEG